MHISTTKILKIHGNVCYGVTRFILFVCTLYIVIQTSASLPQSHTDKWQRPLSALILMITRNRKRMNLQQQNTNYCSSSTTCISVSVYHCLWINELWASKQYELECLIVWDKFFTLPDLFLDCSSCWCGWQCIISVFLPVCPMRVYLLYE